MQMRENSERDIRFLSLFSGCVNKLENSSGINSISGDFAWCFAIEIELMEAFFRPTDIQRSTVITRDKSPTIESVIVRFLLTV